MSDAIKISNEDTPLGKYGVRTLEVIAKPENYFEGVNSPTIHFIVAGLGYDAFGLQVSADEAIKVRDFLNEHLVDPKTTKAGVR